MLGTQDISIIYLLSPHLPVIVCYQCICSDRTGPTASERQSSSTFSFRYFMSPTLPSPTPYQLGFRCPHHPSRLCSLVSPPPVLDNFHSNTRDDSSSRKTLARPRVVIRYCIITSSFSCLDWPCLGTSPCASLSLIYMRFCFTPVKEPECTNGAVD